MAQPETLATKHSVNHAYQITSKQKIIQFLHQCAFSPPPSTWIKAINNGHFRSWPELTAAAVQKYLSDATATTKGHMKKVPNGVQSTQTKQPSMKSGAHTEDTTPNKENNNCNHVFCCMALADQIDGKIYTNTTGRIPMCSFEGKQYVFVAYDYTTNAILVRAIPDRDASTIVKTFDAIFTYLENKVYQPKFNVLDNEASGAIKQYLTNKFVQWQFVPPNEHRVNAAEGAIQTFKNHFISGLCTMD